MSPGADTHRQHCNRCSTKTNHTVVANHQTEAQHVYTPSPEDEYLVTWTEKHQVVRCNGCDLVSFRAVAYEGDEDDSPFERLYPAIRSRPRPNWMESIPPDARRLLNQSYTARDANCLALALMGMRAVIDVVLVQRVGDTGSFDHKLATLVAEGHTSQRNSDVISAALDAGNAAAHRGFQPAAADLDAVMDIVENLLHSLYHLGSLAARLRVATPPRPARVGPGGAPTDG